LVTLLGAIGEHEVGETKAIGNIDKGVLSYGDAIFCHCIPLQANSHDRAFVEMPRKLHVAARRAVGGGIPRWKPTLASISWCKAKKNKEY
jgi:hypothetical protein